MLISNDAITNTQRRRNLNFKNMETQGNGDAVDVFIVACLQQSFCQHTTYKAFMVHIRFDDNASIPYVDFSFSLV